MKLFFQAIWGVFNDNLYGLLNLITFDIPEDYYKKVLSQRDKMGIVCGVWQEKMIKGFNRPAILKQIVKDGYEIKKS